MKIAQTPKSTITSSKFVPTTLSFNNPCASSRLASCPQIARYCLATADCFKVKHASHKDVSMTVIDIADLPGV